MKGMKGWVLKPVGSRLQQSCADSGRTAGRTSCIWHSGNSVVWFAQASFFLTGQIGNCGQRFKRPPTKASS